MACIPSLRSSLRRLLPLLGCLLLPLSAAAQPAALWELATPEGGLRLNESRLAALRPGDIVDLPLPQGSQQVRISALERLPDGERSLQGQLLEGEGLHVLVLTAGQSALHATLSTPAGLWQLAAARGAQGVYHGSLQQVLNAQADPDDLSVASRGASSPPVQDAGFQLRQQAWPPRVPVGGELRIDVGVRSEQARPRGQTQAWLYFLLDNTELLEAPRACSPASLQDGSKVLGCRLEDFRAGEEKTLSLRLRVDDASHPLVYSTVLLGELRHDLIVEVYRDVLRDSDGDGISDHNEVLLGSDPFDPVSVRGHETTVIDVLALLAEGSDAYYGGAARTRLNHLLNVANRIYADSGVAIRLRLVGLEQSAYPAASLAEDLDALTWQSHPAFADLPRRRRVTGADLVVLLRHSGESQERLCGLANLGAQGLQGDFSADYQKDLAYSVVNLDCLDDSVLAHEIGHNLGLAHSRLENPEGGSFAHGVGHGLAGEFASVMAYPGDFPGAGRVYRLASPRLSCGTAACGVDAADAEAGADAVAALNAVRHQIAAYYPSLEERLHDLQAMGAAGAVIRGGASVDGGLSYASSFPAGSAVDILGLIEAAPADLGREATLHAVVQIVGQGLFQVDGEGRLLPWDLDRDALLPLGEPVILQERLRLEALSGFSALAGQHVNVYLAYRPRGGELVFSGSPLQLRFGAAEAR